MEDARTRWGRVASVLAHLLVIALALGLLARALDIADPAELGGRALLDVLPAEYYGSLALLVVGFVVAVTARRLEVWVLILYTLGLIALLHAPVPVLFEEPRYPWTFKHIAVVDFISVTGETRSSLDIYNNWPGFFAVNAWLSDALDIRPLDYARWAQPAFSVAGFAAVVFALRGFTSHARMVFAAGWVFVAANWVGQEYFAPQAAGFVLGLVIVGLVLRGAADSRRRPRARRGLAWVDRLGLRLTRGEAIGSPSRTELELSQWWALGFGALCWLALVVTHQLTPVFVLARVFTFALVTGRLSLWIPVAMTVVEGLWILQALPWLADNVDFVAPDLASSARPAGVGDNALSGQELVKYAQLAVIGVLSVAAGLGAWLRIRAGRWEPPLYALLLLPALVVTAQRYGGEGPLRAYLFALPFLAFLAVAACSRLGRVRRVRFGLLAALVAAAAPIAVFGLELANRVHPEDLRTAAWVERAVPRDAARVYPADVSVRELTAGYARLEDAPVLRLSREERYRGGRWDERTVAQIDSDLRDLRARVGYVILTPGQSDYLELYGIVPAGSFEALESALPEDENFSLVRVDGDARVFRWSP